MHSLLQGEHGSTRWQATISNNWGMLAQGNETGGKPTNIIDFVPFGEVPKNKIVTYASFVCDPCSLKDENGEYG